MNIMGLPTSKTFNGKTYELFDAYPSKKMAEESARDYRNQPSSTAFGSFDWFARVVDGGKDAGRLRYGLYVRRERK